MRLGIFLQAAAPGGRQVPAAIHHLHIRPVMVFTSQAVGTKGISAKRLAKAVHSGLQERSGKGDPHAAIDLALLLDGGDGHAADLAGLLHMRAAAGLQIERFFA